MFNEDDQKNSLPVDPVVQSPVGEVSQSPEIVLEPKKKNKVGLVILIVVLALLILSGAGLAAYYFMQPNYEEILQDALEKTASASSNHYKAVLTGVGDYSQTENNKIEASFVLDAEGDVIQVDNEKINLTSDVNLVNSKGDYAFNLGLSIKNINDVLFIKVNQIPEIPLLPADALAGITENWIKIDVAGLKEQYGLDQMIDGYLEKNPELKALQEKDAEQKIKMQIALKKYIFTDQVFTFGEIETMENGAQKMYKYNFVLNEMNVPAFLQHIGEEIEDPLTEEEQAEVIKALDNIQDTSLSVLVGAEDHYIYESVIKITITNNDVKGTLNLQVNLSDFNTVKEIVPPADSLDIQEFIAQMMQPTVKAEMPDYVLSEKDLLNSDSDEDGLSDYDEMYYFKSDPENADTDGDGFSDGDEVDNGYSPLKVNERIENSAIFFLAYPAEKCGEPNLIVTESPVKDFLPSIFNDLFLANKKGQAFVSSIDLDVMANSYTLKDSYLILDLNKPLSEDEACVASAEKQITMLASAFEGVEFVLIQVNGSPEKVLLVTPTASFNY